MTAAARRASVNLLDLKPSRTREWEALEGECLAILQPRFSNRFLVKWLLPKLRNPNIKIKLDEVGSFAWKHCDGELTVSEIAEKLTERFGKAVEPACERLAVFLKYLERYDFIIYKNIDEVRARDAEPSAEKPPLVRKEGS